MPKKHLKAVNIIMTIAFAAILWQTVSLVINNKELDTADETLNTGNSKTDNSTTQKSQDAPKNIFGSLLNKTSNSKQLFILKGTITANTKLSAAIIEMTEEKEQKLYHIGDNLPDDSTLTDIKRQYITLKTKSNETKYLWINKHQKGVKNKDSIKKISGKKWEIKKDVVNSNLKNINALLKEARIIPHFKNNEPNGFKLKQIKSNSFFARIGIKNEDIIKSINDIEIKSPVAAIKALTSFMANETDSIKITLERNNKDINLHYKIN